MYKIHIAFFFIMLSSENNRETLDMTANGNKKKIGAREPKIFQNTQKCFQEEKWCELMRH